MERVLPVLDKLVIVTLFTFVAFSMFSISIAQISCGLGGFAWLLRTHLRGAWKDQRWPMGIPFALFALACIVAVIDAYDVSYSFESLKKLFEMLIFFWVLNCIKENGLRDSLTLLLIVSATLAGLFGFYQGWRSGINIENRVEGTMSVYMTFAGLLLTVGMLALGRAMFRRPLESWLWPAIGIIFVCILFTFSRQAWFGFLVGGVFLAFIWKRKLVLISAGLVLGTLLIFGSQIRSQVQDMTVWDHNDFSFKETLKYRINRTLSGKDETFRMRVALWKGGWEILKDHPLTGCGFRCVDLINDQYPDPTGYIKQLRGMHNNFVQLMVDTGIIGLTAWLGIWVCFFRLLYQRAKVLKGDSQESWVVYGSASAALAFLAGGCFETNMYDSEVAMVLYFIMALPFAGSQDEKYASGD